MCCFLGQHCQVNQKWIAFYKSFIENATNATNAISIRMVKLLQKILKSCSSTWDVSWLSWLWHMMPIWMPICGVLGSLHPQRSTLLHFASGSSFQTPSIAKQWGILRKGEVDKLVQEMFSYATVSWEARTKGAKAWKCQIFQWCARIQSADMFKNSWNSRNGWLSWRSTVRSVVLELMGCFGCFEACLSLQTPCETGGRAILARRVQCRRWWWQWCVGCRRAQWAVEKDGLHHRCNLEH